LQLRWHLPRALPLDLASARGYRLADEGQHGVNSADLPNLSFSSHLWIPATARKKGRLLLCEKRAKFQRVPAEGTDWKNVEDIPPAARHVADQRKEEVKEQIVQLASRASIIAKSIGLYTVVMVLMVAPAFGQMPPNQITGVIDLQKGQWRLTKLTGLEVYNERNQKIGSIEEFTAGRSGKIETAILGVGGFLGIADRLISVKLRRTHIR
jgi:hypothetical protein